MPEALLWHLSRLASATALLDDADIFRAMMEIITMQAPVMPGSPRAGLPGALA